VGDHHSYSRCCYHRQLVWTVAPTNTSPYPLQLAYATLPLKNATTLLPSPAHGFVARFRAARGRIFSVQRHSTRLISVPAVAGCAGWFGRGNTLNATFGRGRGYRHRALWFYNACLLTFALREGTRTCVYAVTLPTTFRCWAYTTRVLAAPAGGRRGRRCARTPPTRALHDRCLGSTTVPPLDPFQHAVPYHCTYRLSRHLSATTASSCCRLL